MRSTCGSQPAPRVPPCVLCMPTTDPLLHARVARRWPGVLTARLAPRVPRPRRRITTHLVTNPWVFRQVDALSRSATSPRVIPLETTLLVSSSIKANGPLLRYQRDPLRTFQRRKPCRAAQRRNAKVFGVVVIVGIV